MEMQKMVLRMLAHTGPKDQVRKSIEEVNELMGAALTASKDKNPSVFLYNKHRIDLACEICDVETTLMHIDHIIGDEVKPIDLVIEESWISSLGVSYDIDDLYYAASTYLYYASRYIYDSVDCGITVGLSNSKDRLRDTLHKLKVTYTPRDILRARQIKATKFNGYLREIDTDWV